MRCKPRRSRITAKEPVTYCHRSARGTTYLRRRTFRDRNAPCHALSGEGPREAVKYSESPYCRCRAFLPNLRSGSLARMHVKNREEEVTSFPNGIRMANPPGSFGSALDGMGTRLVQHWHHWRPACTEAAVHLHFNNSTRYYIIGLANIAKREVLSLNP